MICSHKYKCFLRGMTWCAKCGITLFESEEDEKEV